MKLQPARGTRDFLPPDKILRQEVESRLRQLFELYGFNPLETPILENVETLTSKFAGGEEILKEMYTLQDQGKRSLGLRYDLTVPFARLVASNPTLKKPFKRYQMGPVFRDGPMKLGRYRQFDQCDVDVIGSSSLLSDAELLALASSFFRLVKLDVTIFVNNRKVLDALLAAASVPIDLQASVILSIDKLKKIGTKGVADELASKGISSESIKKLSEWFVDSQSSNAELIDKFSSLVNDPSGINEVKEVIECCELLKVSNVRFDPSLARGLSYYTGTVFEVFMSDSSFTSSLAGGGRYDGMIAKLANSKEGIPAVGIGFGIDAIMEVMKLSRSLELKKSVTKVYVIPLDTLKESLEIVSTLRENGISSDIDLNKKSISKNLDYANAYGIPFVIIVGKDELKDGKVKLKSMVLGEEKVASLQEVIDLFLMIK